MVCRHFFLKWSSLRLVCSPHVQKHSSIFIVVIYVAHKGWLKGKVTPEVLHNLFDCAEPRGTDGPTHSQQQSRIFFPQVHLSFFAGIPWWSTRTRCIVTEQSHSLKLCAFRLLNVHADSRDASRRFRPRRAAANDTAASCEFIHRSSAAFINA